MSTVVGTLASGETVVQKKGAHLHADGVADLLETALARISCDRRYFIKEVIDFGRVVGCTDCVLLDESDASNVFYAQRPKRAGFTKFVRHRDPQPCSSIVIIMTLDRENSAQFNLVTAFIGALPEPEPWDERAFVREIDPDAARARAMEFWLHRALVAKGSEGFDPDTETGICPW